MIFFYIETPIQAICAYEVISNSKEDYFLIARFNRHLASDIQLKNTLEYLNLQYDCLALRPGYDARALFAVLTKVVRYLFLRNKEVLYIGDYFSKFGEMLKKTVFRRSRCIYLDDGLSTLKAIDKLNKSQTHAEFYTLFHRDIKGTVISSKNNLAWMTSKVCGKSETVGIIIGTHYVESGFASLDDYVSLLSNIISKYEYKFIYYAHREAKDVNTDTYGKVLGVEIERSRTPIEITLIEKNIYPKALISVLSSASFSLKYLFPESDSYVVELPEAARSYEENYEGIVSYAKQIFGESNVLKVENTQMAKVF